MMRINIEGLEIKNKRIDGKGFEIRNFKIIFGKGNTPKNITLQKKKNHSTYLLWQQTNNWGGNDDQKLQWKELEGWYGLQWGWE